jgi:beta-lactamase regulating signal transducer with metallopeptidase domain
MPFFFIYLLKLSVCLSVVFMFYHFVLRKLTFYDHNRWYLLGYTLLSFFIPLVNVSGVLEKNNWEHTNVVTWVPVIHQGTASDLPVPAASTFSAWDILLIIIATGTAIMLVRLLMQLFSFRRLLKNAVPVTTGNMHVYQVNGPIIPFSFGNSIFINNELHSEEELKEIIHHEFVHVKQRHSLDIIWSEILCLINWYNPFAWWLKKSIRQNLEFIADHKVLQKGANKKEYQYLLLKVTGHNHYSIATPFNFSSLKKRIVMMNKTKSAKRQLIRLLFLLPATAVLLLAFRSKWNEHKKNDPDNKLMPGINGSNGTRENSGAYHLIDTVPNSKLPESVKSIITKADFVEVWLKNGKKETYDLSVASQKEAYEKKYGKLPEPPAPPVPVMSGISATAPDAPPVPDPVKLPKGVHTIHNDNDKVTVTLSNGQNEYYDLSVAEQKTNFEDKYGKLPLPPPPPQGFSPVAAPTGFTPAMPPGVSIAPASTPLPANVKGVSVNNNKVTVQLKNGKEEKYDLSIPAQKDDYESKYGKLPPPPPPPPRPIDGNTPAASTSPVKETRSAVTSGNGISSRSANRSVNVNAVASPEGVITNNESMRTVEPAGVASANRGKGETEVSRYIVRNRNEAVTIETKPVVAANAEAVIAGDVNAVFTGTTNEINLVSPAIEITDSKRLVLLDGKEITGGSKQLTGNYKIVTLSKEEAVKKYGNKGKNGATLITTNK